MPTAKRFTIMRVQELFCQSDLGWKKARKGITALYSNLTDALSQARAETAACWTVGLVEHFQSGHCE